MNDWPGIALLRGGPCDGHVVTGVDRRRWLVARDADGDRARYRRTREYKGRALVYEYREPLIIRRRRFHRDRGHTLRYRLYEELAAAIGRDTLYDSEHQ